MDDVNEQWDNEVRDDHVEHHEFLQEIGEEVEQSLQIKLKTQK
jgi:hypothetical protein